MNKPRWRTLAAGLVTMLLAAPLLGASPASAEGELRGAVAPCVLDDTCQVRVGSYNIQASRSMEEFKTAVGRFQPKVDVAGLQEIAGHIRNNWLDEQSGWMTYHAPHLGQIPIVWNPEVFQLLDSREHFLAKGRDIEGKTGGLIYKKDTYAPVVRLLHRPTGRLFSVINVHLVQGAINLGEGDTDKPLTYKLYLEQVDSMLDAVGRERAAGFTPIVTGDFNISYAKDEEKQVAGHPYMAFKASGLRSIWKGQRLSPRGTHIDTTCKPGVQHCGAYLDGIWAAAAPDASTVFHKIVHSDHYPLMARFDVPVLPGAAPQPLP